MKAGVLGLLAVALLLFASFALLSRRAAEGSRVARVAALVDGVLLILAGVQALFAAVVLFALKCDETCADSDERPGDWSDRADAWQWWAQLGLAAVGFVALVLAVVHTARRRHTDAVAWLACAALCFAVWVILLASGDALQG